MQLTLTPEHAAVAGVLITSTLLLQWMGAKVGGARKKFNVPYPIMYADSSVAHANEFNCVQRGHQNTLENYPVYVLLQVMSAAEFPLISAAAGAVYLAGRVLYMTGYSTGDPKKRMQGTFGYLGLFTMLGLAMRSTYFLATAK